MQLNVNHAGFQAYLTLADGLPRLGARLGQASERFNYHSDLATLLTSKWETDQSQEIADVASHHLGLALLWGAVVKATAQFSLDLQKLGTTEVLKKYGTSDAMVVNVNDVTPAYFRLSDVFAREVQERGIEAEGKLAPFMLALQDLLRRDTTGAGSDAERMKAAWVDSMSYEVVKESVFYAFRAAMELQSQV